MPPACSTGAAGGSSPIASRISSAISTAACSRPATVAVPTALMQPYDFVAQRLVPARAYENQVFVAYANRCDRERDLGYLGQSCIVAPDGRDIARAGRGEELITGDIDLAGMAESRRLNTYLADRRPELYTSLVEGREEGEP